MFNGLEGIPGSGKSYEAVVYHVLESLKAGRKVITNLPLNVDLFAAIDAAYPALIEIRRKPRPVLGTWDASRVDDKGNGNAFELFADAKEIQSGVEVDTFGHVWDFYDTWRHADGRGALFIVDECHVPFPAVGTDKQVVEWSKLHRHFNQDVLCMTQSFRDMNQPMARLIAMLIKVRKADILGKKNSYVRKVYSGYRGAVISTDIRPYLPQYFPLYKSHTQGNSVAESSASDVAPFLVKFKRFQWAFTVISILICAWAFWPESKPKPVFHESVQRQLKDNAARPPAAPGAPLPLSAASAAVVKPPPEPEIDPEPLREKLIHITGWIKSKTRSLHTFAVSSGGARIFDISQIDLQASGYAWKPLGECMGYLTYKAIVRTVTCDPPTMAAGSNNVPIVIADGSRRSSADKPVALAVDSEFKLR
jgi:zona occludens toxin